MQTITYVTDQVEGIGSHHRDYDRVLHMALQDLGLSMQTVTAPSAAADPRDPIFYSMFDTEPRRTSQALLRAAARSLQGRRTVGLFFRPGSCFATASIKYAVRNALFRAVSRLPNVRILSILPFTVSPNFAAVATNWIYDPQLWDLHYLGVPAKDCAGALEQQLSRLAGGRRIVVALGGQNRRKGFACMARLWDAAPELRDAFLFVAAGMVDDECRAQAEAFERNGGLLIDRRIDDPDLFCLYRKAFAVWSCYAPDYDQSSGIHGRAVQLGVPVIVRRGSLIQRLETQFSHPTLAIPFDDVQESSRLLAHWQPGPVDRLAREAALLGMRNHSLSVLAEALGGTMAHAGP